MRPGNQSRGLSIAALAAAAFLAGCASDNAATEAEAARVAAEIAARSGPPIALNQSVADAAAVYMSFSRDMAALEGGFTRPEQIQDALRRGAAYDPGQISRGLVAYGAILALQSPEFVSGVRSMTNDRASRERLVADIVADPGRASTLPGAEAAAGLVMATLSADINSLGRAATSIENDAYAIQARYDPRRAWAVSEVRDRVGRLETVKARSAQTMLPSAQEAANLFAAAHSGGGALHVDGEPRKPPYPPAVVNALALAALAALGYAGENARANTDALQFDRFSQGCLGMSKLNLYQCLAASRPNYEDMFCLGRHVVRDLATCSRGAAMPAPIVTVSDVTPTDPPPRTVEPIVISPAPPPATPEPPAPRRDPSITERLNAQPGRASPD
ncbi:hypothetical protein GCM10009116_02110 [Brevundimonas basaltis]|uniref:Uncharacterized protein n=1 Tax=Brevundimonas basaltis TaxID=472166 RepID=A0A7W8MHR1_9CAUL|nr:hypothetical protein [Brevundimonas basaltis]MBB5292482.1 hypothetical protein [Brevundimonas basaltis]